MAKRYQKHNKYDQKTPQRDVDYHGLDPTLGESGLRKFTEGQIKECKLSGIKVVRLIVGKGLHSENGPVIKPIVMRHLQELKREGHIESFSFDTTGFTGPNEGALVVKL